jgi:hypothetical protein
MAISSALGPRALALTQLNFGNLLINGAMQVSQRSAVGTAVTGITSAEYYTADRWRTEVSSLGTWTQTTIADAPTGSGFRNSVKLACTTANASPAASNLLIFRQRIEGQNLQAIRKGTASAQTVTLSFWVKSFQTGTFIVELQDVDNSRACSKAYTVAVSNTWEYKTITFPADVTGVFDNDNAQSLIVNFWLGAGSDYTSGTLATTWGTTTNANRAVGVTNLASSTNNNWFMTGAQLTVGEVALPFEFKSFADDLQDCMRYYYRTGGEVSSDIYLTGYQPASTNIIFTYFHPVTMRATPSLAQKVGTWLLLNTPSQPIIGGASTKSYYAYITVNAGITNANQSGAYTNNSTTYFEFSSEL